MTVVQPDLFEVYEHAPDDWRERAEALAVKFAHWGEPFSADDLRAYGLDEPDHPNRWGALFNTLSGRHLIQQAGFTTSTRPERHGSVLRLWTGAAA
jgi:hypothetical protein